MTKQSAPLTDRRYVLPLILITSLFFLWALGVNLNDILIPQFKKTFQLSDRASSLVQFAFFGGYFLAALPAGKLMERIGYKKGLLFGLFVCAFGAFLFIPAASTGLYIFFLIALFVMAFGQGFLETGANPYVTILGPPESSERRLNLAQSFNAVGAFVTPYIGKVFILTSVGYSAEQLSQMSPAQLQAYSASLAARVKMPYLVITGVFLFVFLLIFFARLPEVQPKIEEEEREIESPKGELSGLLAHKHLVRGVLAQFFYVGAQVGVTSFIIRFAEHTLPGTSDVTAADYLWWHLLGFMIGRFAGSAMMKKIAPPRLLSTFAGASVICALMAIFTAGVVPIWAVVFIGFFHSIMFPTIFALSLKNLGPYTKLASSFLVMAIIGGALFPVLMGYISDISNIQWAFAVPLVCYVYVLYFATKGYKPTLPAAAGAARVV
ncbi:MAG TPA: L-fucose:H+ symporter permease [Candidatus Acidoferrales bacterium]|nr:L-fucose:H+ symporter permease [Candidatus Acidoferrales bacterium]